MARARHEVQVLVTDDRAMLRKFCGAVVPMLVDRVLLPIDIPDARLVLYVDALPVRSRPGGVAREDHTTIDPLVTHVRREDDIVSGVQQEDHMYVDKRVQ